MAIHLTPPEPGKSNLVIEIECSDHAKASCMFDQINGEILDHGEFTLTVTKPRRLMARDND